MLQHNKALKCVGTLVSEYNNTETNSITTSNQQEHGDMENSITCTENLVEFTTPYKNKEVVVHLEFPDQQDEASATDFISRLKEIYMKKLKSQSGQGEIPALQCNITREEEENTNG